MYPIYIHRDIVSCIKLQIIEPGAFAVSDAFRQWPNRWAAWRLPLVTIEASFSIESASISVFNSLGNWSPSYIYVSVSLSLSVFCTTDTVMSDDRSLHRLWHATSKRWPNVSPMDKCSIGWESMLGALQQCTMSPYDQEEYYWDKFRDERTMRLIQYMVYVCLPFINM